MSKANVNFYKEKGAAEAAYNRKTGKDEVKDVTLKIFSPRRISIIDLEQRLTTSLSIMSKFKCFW